MTTYRFLVVGKGPATDPAIREANNAPDLARRAVELKLLEWEDNDYAVIVSDVREDREVYIQMPEFADDPSVRHIIPIFGYDNLGAGNADDAPDFLPAVPYSIRAGIPAREWYEFDSDVFLDELVRRADDCYTVKEEFSDADRQAVQESMADEAGWTEALAAEKRGEHIFYARDEDGYWFGIGIQGGRS